MSVRESLRLQYIRHAVGLRGRSHPERRAGVGARPAHERDVVLIQGGQETQTLHLNADVLALSTADCFVSWAKTKASP